MTMSLNVPAAELGERARHAEPLRGTAFQSLLYTIFQKPRELDASGIVVALTSSNRGEGVTHVARQLVHELGGSDYLSVACVNVNFLRRLYEPSIEAIRNIVAKPASRPAGDMKMDGKDVPGDNVIATTERRGPWEGSWQYRRECIELLRSEFEHTIIDCPSLEESGDLLSIAPFVDGVIVVVEANRTRREQPRQVEQQIAAAGGRVLGYILNKRTYDVPRWLYDRL